MVPLGDKWDFGHVPFCSKFFLNIIQYTSCLAYVLYDFQIHLMGKYEEMN